MFCNEVLTLVGVRGPFLLVQRAETLKMQTDTARDGNESGSSTNRAVETQQVPQFGAMSLRRNPATSLLRLLVPLSIQTHTFRCTGLSC